MAAQPDPSQGSGRQLSVQREAGPVRGQCGRRTAGLTDRELQCPWGGPGGAGCLALMLEDGRLTSQRTPRGVRAPRGAPQPPPTLGLVQHRTLELAAPFPLPGPPPLPRFPPCPPCSCTAPSTSTTSAWPTLVAPQPGRLWATQRAEETAARVSCHWQGAWCAGASWGDSPSYSPTWPWEGVSPRGWRWAEKGRGAGSLPCCHGQPASPALPGPLAGFTHPRAPLLVWRTVFRRPASSLQPGPRGYGLPRCSVAGRPSGRAGAPSPPVGRADEQSVSGCAGGLTVQANSANSRGFPPNTPLLPRPVWCGAPLLSAKWVLVGIGRPESLETSRLGWSRSFPVEGGSTSRRPEKITLRNKQTE